MRDIEHKTYDPADFINGLKEQINQIVKDVLSDNSARHVTITTEEDLKKSLQPRKLRQESLRRLEHRSLRLLRQTKTQW